MSILRFPTILAGVPDGGSSGQVLQMQSDTEDDFAWTTPPLKVLQTEAYSQLASTTTDTTIATCTIAANTLGSNDAAMVHLGGYYANASGSASTLQITVLYGSAYVYLDLSGSIASGLLFYPWELIARVRCQNSSTSKRMTGKLWLGDGTTAPTNGYGDLSTGIYTGGPISSSSSAASASNASNQTFLVKAKHSVSNAFTLLDVFDGEFTYHKAA